MARQVRTLPARWSGEGGGREDPGGPLRSPSTVAMPGGGRVALSSLVFLPASPRLSRRVPCPPCGGRGLQMACSGSVLEARAPPGLRGPFDLGEKRPSGERVRV